MTASRVTVVVDSRYGSTLALARAVTSGAASEGAEVRLCRVAIDEPEFRPNSVSCPEPLPMILTGQRVLSGVLPPDMD